MHNKQRVDFFFHCEGEHVNQNKKALRSHDSNPNPVTRIMPPCPVSNRTTVIELPPTQHSAKLYDFWFNFIHPKPFKIERKHFSFFRNIISGLSLKMFPLETQHCNSFGTRFQVLSIIILTNISIHLVHVSCNWHELFVLLFLTTVATAFRIGQERAEIHVHVRARTAF